MKDDLKKTDKYGRIDLIEADGKAPNYNSNGYMGKDKDLFPAGATEYTGIADHPIKNIREKNGAILFNYRKIRHNNL